MTTANLDASVNLNQAFDQTIGAIEKTIEAASRNHSKRNPGSYSLFTEQIVNAYKNHYRVICIHDRAIGDCCTHPKLNREIKSFNATMVRPSDPLGWGGHTTYKVFLIPEELVSPDGKPVFTVTTTARGHDNWRFDGVRTEHDGNTANVY
jgi:hypothetical protein